MSKALGAKNRGAGKTALGGVSSRVGRATYRMRCLPMVPAPGLTLGVSVDTVYGESQ